MSKKFEVRPKKEKIIRSVGGKLQLFHIDRNGNPADIRDLETSIYGFHDNDFHGVIVDVRIELDNTDIGEDDGIKCRVKSAFIDGDDNLTLTCKIVGETRNGLKFAGDSTFVTKASSMSACGYDFKSLVSAVLPEMRTHFDRADEALRKRVSESMSASRLEREAKRKAELEAHEREMARLKVSVPREVSNMIVDGNHPRVTRTFRALVQNGLSGRPIDRFVNALLDAGLNRMATGIAVREILVIIDEVNSRA